MCHNKKKKGLLKFLGYAIVHLLLSWKQNYSFRNSLRTEPSQVHLLFDVVVKWIKSKLYNFFKCEFIIYHTFFSQMIYSLLCAGIPQFNFVWLGKSYLQCHFVCMLQQF